MKVSYPPIIRLSKYDCFLAGRFLIWTGVSQTWTFLAASYIIVVPLFEEIRDIYYQYLKKSEETKEMSEGRVTVISPYIE